MPGIPLELPFDEGIKIFYTPVGITPFEAV
jgi:hypothetical protein